ncbi:MAG TPA: cobalamin-binding protein [Rhodocyclaceae bacterium]|nr:cobalamin-binding protein [Rhodocyclaceae bacterium]
MNNRLARAIIPALLCLGIAMPAAAELTIRDDTGRELRLPGPARRIVSLAPHVTEILYAAGAGARVVGAVAYSDYPEAARSLPQVGGYNSVDMEAVAALQPDLVIAWQSGNRSAHLGKLEALGIPVYLNEARSLDDVARSLEAFGRLAGTETAAAEAAARFRARRDALAARYRDRPPVRMFYQIWNQPLMTVNGEHLISDVMRLCGGDNVFAGLAQLAPKIGVEAVLAANPEVIVASGMGDARPEWLDQWKRWPDLAANRADNLYFIPPDLIQRHTPRIVDGAERLCAFLEEARRKRDVRAR